MMPSKAQVDLKETLKDLSVQCDNVEYGYCSVMTGIELSPADVLGLFRENEGVSIIATKSALDNHNLAYDGVFAQLTLAAQTSLEMVGLTAALTAALAEAGVPANVVSAYHHDHIFVPYKMRDKAIKALEQLRGH